MFIARHPLMHVAQHPLSKAILLNMICIVKERRL
jgi:hypothetical protein